jgi:quinoprotein glucose dehydrogenase
MKIARSASFVVLAFFSASVFAAKPLPEIQTQVVYPNVKLTRPIWMSEANDGSHRMFLVQQDGKILILPKDPNSAETKTFLDISDRKPFQKNEEGLLGFQFHPNYKSNGKFYVYYSQQDPKRSVISEFTVSKNNPDEADKSSERILLQIPEPNWNHNGGELLFGRDGFLYIGLGDGGGGNDQYHNGQNKGSLLAKILRIDVNSRAGDLQYGIPKSNPFVNDKEFRPEIYAWGFRNPWRFSFDRKTGELYCGDVGQNKWEEIDIVKKGGNHGWSFREGFHEFSTNTPPADAKFVDPILDYPHFANLSTNHSPGLSITGGYVYRGKKFPSMQGVYFYTDFVSGTLWGLRHEHGKVVADGILEPQPKGEAPRQYSSFAEDNSGELYVLSLSGTIRRIVAK